MERGLLEKDSLQKDIAQIEFYSQEEKNRLYKIYATMLDCCKTYTSANADLLSKEIEHNSRTIEQLSEKRRSYGVTLDKAIHIYDEMSKTTIDYFKGVMK